MKLRRRLFLSVILMVLVTMTFISFGLQRAYSDSFYDYLEQEEKNRLQRIVSDIGTITCTQSLDLTSGNLSSQLQIYARDSHINIAIMDNESNIVATYQGLPENQDSDIKVNQYELLNSDGDHIGSMLLTHDRRNPTLTRSLRIFQIRSVRSTLLGITIFGIVATLFIFYFSKKITDRIEALRLATNQLRQQNYEITLEDSDINEIQSLGANIQFLAATLRQQDHARRSYAQDISHELRTPLTNMKLHIEAMKDGMIPANEENLSVLEDNISQLTRLVERLRETFHESSLVAAEDVRHVDVSALTEQIIHSFEPAMAPKNASFTRAIEEGISLQTDARLYSQILNNLLSNAIKAISEEGNIRISLNREKNQVVLSVTDNGVGIPIKDLPHLFERFYRVDSSRNRAEGGQGLGLSITRNIVQQLGGRIEVKSRVGKGTTFRVLFPTQFFESKEKHSS